MTIAVDLDVKQQANKQTHNIKKELPVIIMKLLKMPQTKNCFVESESVVLEFLFTNGLILNTPYLIFQLDMLAFKLIIFKFKTCYKINVFFKCQPSLSNGIRKCIMFTSQSTYDALVICNPCP